MYTDNLSNALKIVYDNGQLSEFIDTALKFLSDELKNSSPRKGEFKNRVNRIINGEGHDLSFDYLNSYLHSLDKLYTNGAYNALMHGNPEYKDPQATNLVNLLYESNIKEFSINRNQLLILNKVIAEIVSMCISNSKGETTKELETFLSFTSWIKQKKNNQ